MTSVYCDLLTGKYSFNTINFNNQIMLPNCRIESMENLGSLSENINDRSEVKINYVKDIDLSVVKPGRSGVIVYTIYKGKIYFVTAVDNKTKDITDFGGGVAFKTRNENSITGGLREHREESLGIFGTITAKEIGRCLAVYDNSTMIIFVPLKINLKSKYIEFLNRVKEHPNPEVIDLCFLNKRQFLNLITSDSGASTVDGNKLLMYHRVKNLLQAGYLRHNFLRLL